MGGGPRLLGKKRRAGDERKTGRLWTVNLLPQTYTKHTAKTEQSSEKNGSRIWKEGESRPGPDYHLKTEVKFNFRPGPDYYMKKVTSVAETHLGPTKLSEVQILQFDRNKFSDSSMIHWIQCLGHIKTVM